MVFGPFDGIEVLTLGVNIIAFVFILLAYRSQKGSECGYLTNFFLVIATFILFNRIFTNVEVLGYGDFFNFFEHLSVLGAAVVFVFLTKTHREARSA